MSNHTYKLSNRILAMALAFVLVFGMLPTSAFAVAPSTVTTDLGSKSVIVGEYTEFTVHTTPNDDIGTMVFGYFDFNGGDWSAIESLQYKESKDGNWYDLPQGAPFGPPGTGFPMAEATSSFRVKFKSAGTYSFSVSMKTVEGGEELCTLSENVTASIKPSEITTDIAEQNFVVGTSTEFTFTSIPNGHAGEYVFGKFTFSDWDAVEKLEYWGVTENQWLTLPKDVLFGPAGTGFPMTQATTRLQVTFNKAGTYTCTVALVKASDTNVALSSIEKEITVTETIPPVVDTITGNPADWAQSATITGTVSDQGGSGVLKVVYSSESAYAETHTAANLENGAFNFKVTENGTYYVWAIDGNGNVSVEAKAIVIDKVDTTAPELEVLSDPNTWTNGEVTIEITASDANGVTVKYNTTDDFSTATDLPLVDGKAEIPVSAEGNGSYYVWATDTAGNTTGKNVTVQIDKTKPTVVITSVPPTAWANGDVLVEGTVADTASGIDKVVYGTSTNPEEATNEADIEGDQYSFTVTENGIYNVWSLDKAGNYSDIATITITYIDKAKPNATVADDEYAWTKDSVTVSGTATDAASGVASVWYNTSSNLDNAIQAFVELDGSYSFVVSNATDVATTYYIWVKDNAGNYSEPVTTKVQIDITKPSITAEKETTGWGWGKKTVVSGSVADTGSGIKRVVYGTENDITKATGEVTVKADGTYSFNIPRDKNFNGTYYIWVEDNVGNVTAITADGITVDMVPPTVDTIIVTPNVNDTATWTNGSVVISGTASDKSDATYNTSVEEIKYATEDDISKATSNGVTLNADGTFSFTVSNNKEFNGYYYVWAIDEHGMESESSKIFVKIDTTKPTATIKISTKTWSTLLDALTFGIFSNNQLDVSIEANDASSTIANSGVANVEYYKVSNDNAKNLLSREALVALDASVWTTGNSISVSSDEVFVVYAKVTDNAGNVEYFCSDGAILDKVDAVIELTPSAPAADNGDPSVYGYYNGDVTVGIKVTDAAPYSGIKSVEYWVTADGNETQRETLFNFTKANPEFSDLVDSWEDNIVIDAEKNNSCNVVLTVKVIDNAGNDIEKSISLDIDKTAPTISVTYNTNVATNDKYFGNVRTATIVITERPHHFDKAAATNGITIIAKNAIGEDVTLDLSTMISGWTEKAGSTPDATTYTATIIYAADANYKFAIEYTDKATNKNTAVDTGDSVAPYEFTIAQAVPTGSVSILTNTWDTLLDALTFGLFANDKFEVVTSASDKTSPIKIEYYKVTNDAATTPLTWAQLNAITNWTLLTDDGKNEVTNMNVLTVDKDEQFVVYLKISNYAGGYTYISTNGAIVDKTQAAIEFTPSAPAADNGDSSVHGYYNGDVTVGINVTDAAPYSGIKSVEYWVTADGNETQRETLFNFDKANPTQAELVNSWTDDIVVEAAKNNSCNVVVYVKVTDNAGNVNTQSVALDIDITAPTINISYDDNAPSNGKYFDGTRTATIVITERSHHFDPEAATKGITITAKDADGKPVTIDLSTMISSWTEKIGSTADATTYTATITYSADANYTFAIEYTDKATNKNSAANTGSSAVPYEFTVDATDPTGSASIGTNVWDKLLEALTFGLYTNDKFDVAASANDITSPLKVEYYKVSGEKAPVVLKAADLDAVTTWSLLVNDGENTFEDLHTLTVSDDEQFVVYFKITDYAGNYIYVCTDGAIVEDTPPVADEPAPEITIEPEQPINGLYNGDVKVDIKVTDPLYGETYSGLKSVSYKVFNMGEVTQEGTLYSFEETAPTNNKLLQTWTGSIVVDSKLNNSNDVKIEVYAQDNALNTSSSNVNIKIDITAPKIDFRYDNDNVDSDTYYKADRTATIVVTERNFKSEDVIVAIKNTDGTIPTISSWTAKEGTGNGDDATYTATITYSADGDYTFAIEYTDLANNKCTEISSPSTNPYAFTIDKTAPTISVSYDNNAVANDKYFNAVRTATVTIVEHNFNVDRVIFTRNTARGGQLPNVTWTTNGDTHVATIRYTVDGDYTFDVTMTDMAGNASGAANYGNSAAGKDFVIDTTFEDMITISGVENGVAYGHDAEVIPNIKITDINLNGHTVKLVGVQKDKTIDLTEEVNKLLNAGNETVTGIFDIFETKQDLDGIYTLTLTSEDKAGNKDSEEIVFTVNRFGSVYVYNQYLLDLIADGGSYVLSVDEDLVIDEFNADRLVADSLKIEITVDGRPLENVKYTCTPEINDTVTVGESGWFQYKYTISKDNFADDGVYKISISSKDATGNKPENTNYEGMEMNFRVDSTKAEITSIVGLEESIINAQEVTVKYTVFDTIGLKSIKVYVNGELVDEITDFSADMNNFDGQFTLLEQANAQSVKIVVEDMSGNITDTSAEDFTSAYAFNDSVTVSTNLFVRWYANKPLFWGSIVGVVVVAGGLGAFFAAKRKKKEEAEAAAK